MVPFPKNFDPKNSHRLVHFFPEPRDFDRLEDLLAGGHAAARSAVEALALLPYGATKPIEPCVRDVVAALEKRRLLEETFRAAIRGALHHLERQDVPDEAAELHDTALRRLREALDLSQRVSDLLAAEREIGFHRGLRA